MCFSLSNGSNSCLNNHTGDIIHAVFFMTDVALNFGSAVVRGAVICNARRPRRIRTGSNPMSVYCLHIKN